MRIERKELLRPVRPIELALSFLPQDAHAMQEAAKKYGSQADFFICFDDLGAKDPYTSLTIAAAALPRSAKTGIGVMGAVIPKLQSTVDLVSFASTIHELRQGKNVTIGMVPGAWMEELGLTSATVGDVREAVESFRYLLRGETTGYAGRRFHVESGFKLGYQPIPEGKVEVFVGAFGPQMLRMAGQIADGIKLGGSANPEMVAVAKERLAAGAVEAGKNVDDIKISMGAVTVVDRDREKAVQKAKELAVVYINVIGDRDITKSAKKYAPEIAAIKEAMRRGDPKAAMEALSDEVLRLFAFAGTPEDIAEQALSLYEAGATRIEFGPPHGVVEMGGVKLLAKEVFPRIRGEIAKRQKAFSQAGKHGRI